MTVHLGEDHEPVGVEGTNVPLDTQSREVFMVANHNEN